MRIAYLNQDPGIAPGRKKGAAVHVAAMHAALRTLGSEVIAIEAKSESEAEAALAGAHAERELDCVYERYALGAEAGARFARRTGVALLLEVNAPLLDEARDERGLCVAHAELERERAIFHSATHLFCVSRSVAAYVARQGVPSERIHLTPNGVDADVFRPDLPRASEIAVPRDAFVLGFHGRLRPWHNLALLGEVVARLAARGYPVHVLAIGEGDFAAHFAPELHATRLTVLPWMAPQRLASHVARFDALPLTYGAGRECYFSPLKLLEAMACGVVPLVPDLGDLPEAVEHGRCGVVYRAGDARNLADAIAGLIEWPEVRARLGHRAVERARSHTWLDVAREVLEHARGVRAA